MVKILLPRSLAQAGLLAAVLALVTCAVTPLGLAALLLGPSRDRAFDVAMSRAPAADVDVTAYLAGVPAAGVTGAVASTRSVLVGLVEPLPATTEVTASSTPRELAALPSAGGSAGSARVGYLGVLDHLAARVRFTAGRAPRAGAVVPEAALPVAAAAALRLVPGDEVQLGPEVAGATPGSPRPVAVRVVGVFTPLPGAGWDRDLLQGAGTAARYFASPRLAAVPAFGPFVVDLADLAAGGSTLERVQVAAHPDLASRSNAPGRAALATVAGRLPAADARLAAALRGGAAVSRVETALPATLALAARQEAVTRAAVLVVVLLAATLSVGALALAGRLAGALRSEETALFASLGASRRQLAAVAAVEAVVVAAGASLLAVPLAGLAATALTHLPVPAGAGLAGGAEVTGGSVLAVAAGALALAAVLVVPALRAEHGVAAAGLPGPATPSLVRSGADVLAAGLAVVGWWQLEVQPPVAEGTDAVRAVAPVLCLLAGVLLGLRLLPPLLAAGDRVAGRSRALVLPLAAVEAARRPQATAGALIVALGTASGTFALAALATWDRSQHEQADLRVGTDLAVALAVPPRAGDGQAVAGATGGTVSPAVRRPVPVGQWVGEPGAPPELVAVETSRAGALLRGRLPAGRTWAGVGAELAPAAAAAGVPLDPAAVPTLGGTASGGAALIAVPRLVLQDGSGVRVADEATAVRLDGHPHPLALAEPVPAGTQVVAVDVQLALDPAAPPPPGQAADDGTASTAITLQLRLPGPGAQAGPWAASSPGGSENGAYSPPLANPSARLVPAEVAGPAAGPRTATVLRMSARAGLFALEVKPAELVATSFAPPGPVPVAVSAVLASAAGVRPGGPLTLTVGGTTVEARVAQVLPDVPSVPGGAGVLADVDLLSRALLAAGDLSPVADAWWVGDPSPQAAERVAALGLGTVRARSGAAEELTTGPLRVLYPVTLGALVPVALLLVLAGTALAVTGDVRARALELARLRALGLRRRDVRRGLLAQHGALLVVLVALGAAVGWACLRLLAPLLIRSDTGGQPVPAVRALWPWGGEGLLLAAYALGCLAVAAAVAVRQARRADTAHLRVGT